MDIHCIKMRNHIMEVPALLLYFCLLFVLLRVPHTFGSTLYFTNNTKIEELENNPTISITPVIDAKSELRALDCNSCDGRIYWTNGKEIKRSFANLSSSIESVLSHGVIEPVGVAVDWRGNNVYFTDQIDDDRASVEVVTCDGKYRQVLFRDNSQIQYRRAGPIVVDSLHGYIFFADTERSIFRANMDGLDPIEIVSIASQPDAGITDLAIDYDTSQLYWVYNEEIFSSNYDGQSKTSIPQSIISGSVPFGVSVDSGVLYWTQKRMGEGNGSIHSYSLSDSSVEESVTVRSSSFLNPYDISAFVPKEVIASAAGGCSVNKGGCEHFCFTMPNSTNPLAISSAFNCSCRTGFRFVSDSISTCAEAPVEFLLVGQGSFISMLSLDIPEEQYLLALPITTDGFVDYVTYDRKNHLVYWTQRDPPAIWRADLNGENKKAIVTESVTLPEGLVLSDAGTDLYWADSLLDKIEVVSLFNEDPPYPRTTLIDMGLDHPIGIAINESTGYIYWTDIATLEEGVVEEAAKDGSHRRFITTEAKLPGPITVDQGTGTIYWSDRMENFIQFRKPNTTGNPKELPVNVMEQFVAGLTILKNELFWTDRNKGELRMTDLNSNGVSSGDVLDENLGRVRDVTSVDNQQIILETPCSNNNGGCEQICVVTLGGSNRKCLCQTNFIPNPIDETRCIDERSPIILLSTSTTVYLRGIPPSPAIIGTLPIAARAMDIDYSQQQLYWIGYTDGVIYTSSLVTSSPSLANYSITAVTDCCYGNISDLVVDWWGRNLYWTDRETGRIWVSKLDGSNKNVLVKGLNSPTSLVLDPYRSEVYFVEDNEKIRRISMNGNGDIENVIATDLPIRDLGIDVSKHILYWSEGMKLYEYNLETSKKTELSLTDVDEHPFVIAFYDNSIFYDPPSAGFHNKFNTITRMPGFGFVIPQEVMDNGALSMAISHHSLQPDTHWCVKTNGECEGDPVPLCLVSDRYNRTCRCAATEFLYFDYDSFRDVCRPMCRGTPAFVLLATSSEVLHLSLDDPTNFDTEWCGNPTPTPNSLPLGEMGRIQAISYDPVYRRIFWSDGSSDSMSSINYTTTDRQILKEYDQLNTVSMGYDWRGGNLIWAEDYSTKLSFISGDGQGFGVINNEPYSPANVWEPIQVAVDWENSVVYWSDSANLALKKLNLGSISSSSSLPVSKLQIRLLAIEPHHQLLYWYNVYNGINVIQRYNIATQNVTTIINVMQSDEVTAMTATTVNEHVFLLWYNETDWSVYYYNDTSGTIGVYAQLEKHTVIVSMAAYDDNQYKSSDGDNCLAGTRPCSHICSQASLLSSATCQCPLYRKLDENNECSELQCDTANLLFCEDNSTCYSESQRCDGIKHCDDASDESSCDNACDQSLGYVECIPDNTCEKLTELCGEPHGACISLNRCNCTGDEFFQCAISKRCLPIDFKCDNEEDCKDGAVETIGCPTSTTSTFDSRPTSTLSTTPSTTEAPPPSSNLSQLITSIVSVLGVIALFIAIGICAVVARCFIMMRRRKDIDIRHEGFSMKTTSSPQNSSPMRSISSDMSINTMDTHSTNVDRTSQEARLIKRLSTLSTDPSNPPNSPITRRSVALTLGDEMTMYSEFDPPIPPPPNPSVDYDAISEGITSVSQRRYPGVITSNGGFPRIDEDHGESPPPPYCNHPVYEQDEESVVGTTAYKDFCPPIIPDHSLNHRMVHLDDISETTFSITANELIHVHHPHDYSYSGYLPNTEQNSHVSETPQRRHENHLEEEHVIHPYDRPPPPSPVTVYSIHGD